MRKDMLFKRNAAFGVHKVCFYLKIEKTTKKELREKLDMIEGITREIANAEYERMAVGQE